MDELRENFILEATELLDEAEEALLDFDTSQDFDTCYNKVFRAFHSLKGAAGMFGIDLLQEHLHKLETELSGISQNFPEGSIDYFLGGIDASRSFFDTDKIEFEYNGSSDFSGATSSAVSDIKSNVESEKEVKNIVESKVENKVEVKATPPVKKVATNKLKEQKKETKKSKLGKVYVVDDEPLILDLICEVLEDTDAEVLKFNDGEEVLDNVEKDMPDLIISDIKMSKVDGLTMSKELVNRDVKIPIIFVSGFVTKKAVLAGLESGSHFFIEKPFDENNLLSLVVSVLKSIKARRLLEHSLDYVMYQFANQEDFLIKNGREKEVELIRQEIKNLINLKKDIFF